MKKGEQTGNQQFFLDAARELRSQGRLLPETWERQIQRIKADGWRKSRSRSPATEVHVGRSTLSLINELTAGGSGWASLRVENQEG